MNFEVAERLLKEKGQEQLIKYYGELNDTERSQLLTDISRINFSVVECINEHGADKNLKGIAPIPAKSLEQIKANSQKFREEGLKQLRAG